MLDYVSQACNPIAIRTCLCPSPQQSQTTMLTSHLEQWEQTAVVAAPGHWGRDADYKLAPVQWRYLAWAL